MIDRDMPLRPGRRALGVVVGLAALGFTGCAAPPRPRDLTREQVDRLKAAGFTPALDGGWEYLLSGRILFETDADSLDPDSQLIVTRLAPLLGTLGVPLIRVEGHTDSVGSEAYNMALSLRRAQAVGRALQARGVQAEIRTVGHGKTRPVAQNLAAEGRAQNRRVAIIVPGP